MFFAKSSFLPRQSARHHWARGVLTTLLALAVATRIIAADGTRAVSVRKAAPEVTYRVFDPANPPKEIRGSFRPDEVGLCQYEFSGKARSGVELPRYAAKPTTATVTTVHFDLTLKITIWTANGAVPKVRRHEETHRRICEEYYRTAHETAEALARRAIGRKLPIPARNRSAATDRALDEFQAGLLASYLSETATRCSAAQIQFDLITDHGRNSVSESEAMVTAVRREKSSRERAGQESRDLNSKLEGKPGPN